MNLKHIFTLLLFSIIILTGGTTSTYSPSAKVICLYRIISRPDSTSETTWTEFAQLAISDSSSEFRSFARYKGDSLLIKYGHLALNSPGLSEGMNAITNLPKYNFKGVIIKDLKAHSCSYYGTIGKVLYSYKEDSYPVTWQLSSDAANISGYKCQKAFTKFGGRKYTAWFTRQIPINNGPYLFDGLPGLIVSISDATNSYKFELTRIYQPKENYHIILPGKIIYYKQPGKPVSKREYYRSYYDYQENFIDKSLASGMTRFDDEDGFRKSYREKMKHRNNPIELDYKKL